MSEIFASLDLPIDETYALQKQRIQNGTSNKRLCIVTGTHGDELEGQFVCFLMQQKLAELYDELDGIVDIYPCLNPLGMDSITRSVPMFDVDMNRMFPGDKEGNFVEYMASEIIDELCGADLVVDIHASNIYLREIPQIRINQLHRDWLVPMAKWCNVDYIWVHAASTVLENTLAYSLNQRDTATLVIEMGVGMRLTYTYGIQITDGLLHAMHELGMLKSDTKVKEPIVSQDGNVFFLNAPCAGVFVTFESVEHKVKKDQALGYIVDPLEGERKAIVKSPCDGLLFTLREYPLVSEGSLLGRILGVDL